MPEGASRPGASGSNASGVVLLTGEVNVAQRTTVSDLSGLVMSIMRVVDAEIAALKQGQGSDLVVECEVRPGKEMKLGMAQRPSVDRGLTSTLYKKLAAIDPPVVKGPIKFHVTFKIRGGSNSGDWEPISSP
jgi:hypothetical protein